MRALRALLLAILVAAVVLVALPGGGAPAAGSQHRPTQHRPTPHPQGHDLLPAPILLTSGHLAYLIGRDGRSHRVAAPRSAYPRDAAVQLSGAWYMFRGGHLLVGQGARPLWRSHEPIGPNQIGVIIANSSIVAFQHAHQLYVARLPGGAEQPIAPSEMPLGFTNGGIFTYSYPANELLLRSDTGALLKVIARGPREYGFPVAGDTLYFLAGHTLMGATGANVRRLDTLSSLGLPANTGLMPLSSSLVSLIDGSRLVLVRANGTVFASTRLPSSGTLSSPLDEFPLEHGSTAVAFTIAYGDHPNPNSIKRVHGHEAIELLRAGARKAVPIHTERVAFESCERGAGVTWHGRWLLYSNSEGNLVAVDAADPHRALDLTRLAHRLPGVRAGFSAAWTGS